MKQHISRQQSGFTIIELMIATSILSTILVMVTVMMVGIGSLFYKGVNQSRVQDTVRSTTEEVGRNLQLTNLSPITGSQAFPGGIQVNAYCIGETGYSYVIGRKIGTSVQHVLWRNTQATPGTCLPADLTNANPDHINGGTNGTELITPNSRLKNFSMNTTSPYTVTIGIAYGDDDLFCSPSVAGSCTASSAMTNPADYQHGDLRCKGKAGDQFCSVSSLTTTVVQRLN